MIFQVMHSGYRTDVAKVMHLEEDEAEIWFESDGAEMRWGFHISWKIVSSLISIFYLLQDRIGQALQDGQELEGVLKAVNWFHIFFFFRFFWHENL